MTQEINNLKRQDQNSEKIFLTQIKVDAIPFDLRTIDREYIWEGKLYEGFKFQENAKNGYYFLFNDLLILAKKRGKRLVVTFCFHYFHSFFNTFILKYVESWDFKDGIISLLFLFKLT